MRNKISLKAVTIAIPLACIILFIQRDYLLGLLTTLPPCIFYTLFDLYCPACGNTRSFISLSNGELLSSLRYNIVPILLLLLCLLAYIELAAYSFDHQITILPRKLKFYIIGIILLILYFIIRNFFPFFTP